MSTKSQLPETLNKKWTTAKRIFEPLNDKKFRWEKQEDESFLLTGIPSQARYHDKTDEKNRKGFIHLNASGRKVLQDSTLNVGVFVRSIKAEVLAAMEEGVEAPQTA